MLTLFHHPICPQSRFVRLTLNPAGTTPVLVEEGGPPVPGAAGIAEYIDETRGRVFEQNRLLPQELGARVEVRRLVSWVNEKFADEVSNAVVMERVYKRYIPSSNGGGSPDTETLRAAKSNIRYHLAYIGWLVLTRDWLPGEAPDYFLFTPGAP